MCEAIRVIGHLDSANRHQVVPTGLGPWSLGIGMASTDTRVPTTKEKEWRATIVIESLHVRSGDWYRACAGRSPAEGGRHRVGERLAVMTCWETSSWSISASN